MDRKPPYPGAWDLPDDPPPWETGWGDEPDPEPEPTRRRPRPVGILIALALVAMLVWESINRPPDASGRFALIVNGETALAYGSTDSHSYDDVERVLDANPQVDRVILRNVPGTSDMGENVRIARLFRDRGIDTHLTRTSYIASGGVHLFLGGEERSMECGARLGVHSWASEDARGRLVQPSTLGYDPAAGFMDAFHLEMGVDEGFHAFTVEAAPHEDIHILSGDEIERFGLLTGDGCERAGWLDWLG